jgi:hypothetical protein
VRPITLIFSVLTFKTITQQIVTHLLHLHKRLRSATHPSPLLISSFHPENSRFHPKYFDSHDLSRYFRARRPNAPALRVGFRLRFIKITQPHYESKRELVQVCLRT